MRLPVFALFTRSLLIEVRSPRAHLTRLVWLSGTLLMIWTATQNRWRFQAAPGLDVFRNVMTLNLILVSIVGIQLFATAITEEKEEQTLGLLQMTALSPVAILLGKSTGRMMSLSVLLVAQLPFTLVTITLGGIGLSQILAAYAALFGLVALLANLALLWSVVFRRGNTAMGLTLISMLLLFAGPPICQEIGRSLTYSKNPELGKLMMQVAEPLLLISPFVRCSEVLGAFDGDILHPQLIANLAMGLFCFVLAWIGFEHFARARPSLGEGRGGVLRAKPEATHTRMFRVSRAWRESLAWKTFYFESYGVLGWIIRFALLAGSVALIGQNARRIEDIAAIAFWLSFMAAIVEGGLMAAGIFRSEQTARTWASVFATPTSLGRLCRQKIGGAALGMFPWFLGMIGGLLLADSADVGDAIHDMFFDHAIGYYLILLFAAFFVLSAGISLWVKRGGSLIAVGFLIILNMLLAAIIQDDDGVAVCGGFLYVIVCALGPVVIAARLREIAAAD
jgi:ABC-type transport system involved in multi-copper enzyme maturation permease subunit